MRAFLLTISIGMELHKNPEIAFSEYAKKVLKEQAAEVKKKYGSKEPVKKALRLKVFNEHLDVLKEMLEEKMNDVLNKAEIKAAKDKAVLEKKLAKLYDDHIHEFLKKDFDG